MQYSVPIDTSNEVDIQAKDTIKIMNSEIIILYPKVISSKPNDLIYFKN